ncbi:MAG: type II secretion system GspH family protein [Candidatus Hydrogenedentes bacterium]|nr:type II secretion system GspH family protein [Candidatus Hydrogenedentota bacterium]
MRFKPLQAKHGVTLLELTIAMAVFTVVLGATAQALISYYVALDTQNQRHTAVRNCTGIVSNMRDVRDANPENFPDAVVALWPDGAEVPNAGSLPQEIITVDYVNPASNPLEITIRSQWVDLRGRPVSLDVSTLLTDR